ncbi:FYVE, RhoGEF and PH domain-containing protein 6-like isoform X3 [Mytilus californianus]|uniref:FYVE, RhoGEF and PH domain-containing protein 6-like isoform X3 n=1 Tax=Mytilus californianus TaxID=6549 RepID=UPI00224811F0|nr:FYVE, RhoGEF and PH domain-containing protein 6-like isoform X3 [Mytilus californianus]
MDKKELNWIVKFCAKKRNCTLFTDETVQGKMVHADADCKRNSLISGKPKPPLPKKPPVAVKPKVLTKDTSEDQGTSKGPPPLPKTPPRGSGSTAVKNALRVKTSPSPDRSCDIKLSNHVTESQFSSSLTTGTSEQPASLLTNHVTESYTVALSGQVEGEKVENIPASKNIFDPYQHRSNTLERTTFEHKNIQCFSVEHSNTLPKGPPKVSPKPKKRPPSVLPKPRLSNHLSESDIQINTSFDDGHLNNNKLDSSQSVTSQGDTCTCGQTSANYDLKVNDKSGDITHVREKEALKNSLDSELQNGHSRPPPIPFDTIHTDADDPVISSKLVQNKNECVSNYVTMDKSVKVNKSDDPKTTENLIAKQDDKKHKKGLDNLLTTSEMCSSLEKDLTESMNENTAGINFSMKDKADGLGQNLSNISEQHFHKFSASKENSPIKNKEKSRENSPIKTKVNSRENSPIKTKVNSRENSPIKTKVNSRENSPFRTIENSREYSTSETKENSPIVYRRILNKERLSVGTELQSASAKQLFVPSPAPRKPSPKPRPTPRKRLSITKSCDQIESVTDYTDCISAKTNTPVSELVSQNSEYDGNIKILSASVTQDLISEHSEISELEEKVKIPKVSPRSNNTEHLLLNSVSPSDDNSMSNISSIENYDKSEGNKTNQFSNQNFAGHNRIQPDESQRKMDFSPMTEEALGETSSLLDEIEQIVSRRITALGGLSTEFSLKKAHSIETSTPVRPPRKKQKNRKKVLEQFSESCASDTDSLIGDASYKGSLSSLNYLDDDDQSFKGSTSSLASNQSESGSRKPCPPKPPRKKLLKLNRSQSDVSASKFLERNKENVHQNETKEEKQIQKDGSSPNLPSRKGRSLTVDFHVPANQEALLREIELANQRNEKKSSSNSDGQKMKPRRKAPPPPPQSAKVTGLKTGELIREAVYDDIDDDKPRTMSIGDKDYVEIPEEFLENMIQTNDNNIFQRSNKSASPPELPPRNLNQGTPINSPQLSTKSFNPMQSYGRERPMSDISVNSSLSSQESPLQDELSSSDSEGEEGEDRVARKRAKKILCIAKEIASSEHVFVDVLKLLNVDFRMHISRATEKAGRPIVPSEVLNRILKYLPQLHNFNEDLLHDLQERVNNWENCKKVADIFVKKGPFLKMYTAYITDFEETNRVFDDAIKKIPTFQQVVKEFEMSPRCASLGVRHYLLKPIQRIPQYKLLLQDYLKHLSPESEDYQSTKTALHIVSEVADHANSSMRQGDQVQKMLEIQKSLEGQFEVIKPGRDLIKKGELMKLSRKEMQPRMFFLFNDVLLYTTPTPTGGYRLNNVLTLSGMKITLPASKEYNTEFNIVTVQRSFTVEASSEKDRDEWVTSLKNTIDDYTQRRNTFETVRAGNQSFYDKDFVLGSKAPIWIPDARVTMCMLCTCEFSVAWRRHHCRSCGRVICSTCSDNRAPLEYLRNKPARVCNECFIKLKTDFQDKVETGTVTESMTEDIDGSLLSLSSLKERFQQIRRSARFSTKVKRPKRLVEVHANNLDCSMSGYLKVLKGKKWKKFWFLLKDKVLYKFKASEDVAAKESMAVIGYEVIKVSENFEGVAANLVFKLSHKNQSPFVFQTDNSSSTDRWIKAMEDAVQG